MRRCDDHLNLPLERVSHGTQPRFGGAFCFAVPGTNGTFRLKRVVTEHLSVEPVGDTCRLRRNDGSQPAVTPTPWELDPPGALRTRSHSIEVHSLFELRASVQPNMRIPVKADRPSILRGLLEIAGMMLPNSGGRTVMGNAHPTWYERATPDEIKEIAEIERAIADLRRRRSLVVGRTKMRTQVWVEHHRPNTDRRMRRR